jgi:biopolymer transport protein ExbD
VIARPLDLATRLRPPPQGTGALHYVNVGLLGLFFSMFGSRFVLAPGLGVDFQVPQLSGAQAGAAQATHVISVLRSGQIFSEEGIVDLGQLREWLKSRAGREPRPTLLVRASSGVTFRVLLGAEERGAGPGPVETR